MAKNLRLNILKSCGFAVFVILVSLAIEKVLDDTNFSQMAELENSLKNGTQIIYFGDSTMRWSGENDTDKRPIGSMLQDILGQSVAVISNNAFHMGVYEAFSRYICSSEKKPLIVIIPLNLRSLSPEWDTRPQYQFKKEIDAIRNRNNLALNLWERLESVFGGKIDMAKEEVEWKNQAVYYNATSIGRVQDFNFQIETGEPEIKNKIRKKFIYHYLYGLNATHRKLISLENIIDVHRNCKAHLLLYITPIDYKTGSDFIGEDFTDIVNKNKQKIYEAVKLKGAEIIDMSFDLNPGNFTYIFSPNEHLDQNGRMHVASILIDAIKSFNSIL